MKVRDVMTTNVVTIDEFTTVDRAIKIMQDNSLRSLIVEPQEKKDSYGILTEIDILHKVVAKGLNPKQLFVHDIVTRPCIEVKPDLNVKSAAQLFAKTGIFYAPIIQKKLFSPKKLLGIISVSDLILKGEFAQQLSKTQELPRREDYSEQAIQGSKSPKSSQPPKDELELTDYQRLRSQGAISAYSTRILDKMPQNESERSDSDLAEQANKIDTAPEKAIQDSPDQKSAKPPKEQLTDYQRLRSQGAISAYSTRILDKMAQSELERSDSEFEEQTKKQENPLEQSTQDSPDQKSAKPPKEQLTDYQRLRAQGSISRYSTRILDKMSQDDEDRD